MRLVHHDSVSHPRPFYAQALGEDYLKLLPATASKAIQRTHTLNQPSPSEDPQVDDTVNAGFGTFTGVFTPTLLTILGVIMYVRLGWVVGNAGLIGAFALMALAMGITACTGLSLSSIATNTRLGAGGPYAIISRSLGLEVGGSIGVPLYLSRPLGVAMYIFGFREGWQWFFPSHSPLLIDVGVFTALFALAYISANLAFKVQYVIMAVIAASLLSILFSDKTLNPITEAPVLFGHYRGFPESGFRGTSFWVVFAIFFPATTGILAGANMSGDLKNPRIAIPRGTLWAIVVSSIIYFLVAWWTTRAATVEELTSNYNIIIDRAAWPSLVLLGLLGATFSSALASAVGGPRILMAMGQHKILPASGWLAASVRGEPRNAILLTALLTFGCLMLRDLNVIAPLVTMFFLITYFVINLVLLVEMGLTLTSFRPSLRVPIWVPFLGAVGCVFVMFIMNPTFGLIAVAVAVAIYIYILKRGVISNLDDVRSGVFSAMAEWAAAKVTELSGNASARAWKPNLLLPIMDIEDAMGEFSFILDVCVPKGNVKLMGVAVENTELMNRLDHAKHLSTYKTASLLRAESSQERLLDELKALSESFRRRSVSCTSTVVTAASLEQGAIIGLQALQSAFFRPNLLFLRLPNKGNDELLVEFSKIIPQAHFSSVGVLLLGIHPKSGLGGTGSINIWVRPASQDWSVNLAFQRNNLDLMLLMGYRLMASWGATLNLITVVSDEAERENALAFLREVRELTRLPEPLHYEVLCGAFTDAIEEAPLADLNILGLQPDPDFEFMRQMIQLTRSSCLFVADSGRESARA